MKKKRLSGLILVLGMSLLYSQDNAKVNIPARGILETPQNNTTTTNKNPKNTTKIISNTRDNKVIKKKSSIESDQNQDKLDKKSTQSNNNIDSNDTKTVYSSNGVRKIIIRKSGKITKRTYPESTITKIIPKSTTIKEYADAYLDIGVRGSFDYHLSPKKVTTCCLWIWAEARHTAWGIQLGLGKAKLPLTSYSDIYGNNAGTGVGTSEFWQVDLIGKYNFWFHRPLWIGMGLTYYKFIAGSYLNTVTTGTNNTLNANDVNPGNGYAFAQIGLGIRLTLAEKLYFAPEVRYLYPLNGDTNNQNGIIRLNLGIAYTFDI